MLEWNRNQRARKPTVPGEAFLAGPRQHRDTAAVGLLLLVPSTQEDGRDIQRLVAGVGRTRAALR